MELNRIESYIKGGSSLWEKKKNILLALLKSWLRRAAVNFKSIVNIISVLQIENFNHLLLIYFYPIYKNVCIGGGNLHNRFLK